MCLVTNMAVTDDEASKIGGGIYREPISGKHVIEYVSIAIVRELFR
jgi:hypothetical protein